MRDSPQGSFDRFEILRTGFHCGPLRASPIQQDFEQRARILVYADELAAMRARCWRGTSSVPLRTKIGIVRLSRRRIRHARPFSLNSS
jgi:hypothetical protein